MTSSARAAQGVENAVRDGLRPTPSTVTSPPGIPAAATNQNAAEEEIARNIERQAVKTRHRLDVIHLSLTSMLAPNIFNASSV
jgi:hypothetical protein